MIDWAIENIKDAIIQFSTKEIDLEKDVLKSTEWHSKSNGVTGPMSNVKSNVERSVGNGGNIWFPGPNCTNYLI